MEWIEDVERKLKRKNMVLFSRDSLLLQELNSMIQQQSHQVLVLWAMELAQETVNSLAEKYPTDTRPASALEAATAWAAGSIKMPIAQRAILDCHAMAKELSSMDDIALCHAVGQACSVVHTAGHALGYPIYELTAIVRKHGIDRCKEIIEARNRAYIEKLVGLQQTYKNNSGSWADFLLE